MRISVSAHEMGAAWAELTSCRREAMVVLRHRFIEIGTEAERRLIRVRKRRNPHPDPARADHHVAQPADQAPANPALGIPGNAFADGEAAERPGSARRAAIDQGRKRIGRLAAPELIDVDQDVRRL